MSYGAINETSIPKIQNMVKVFDISTMAYYEFKPGRSNVLDDAMRNQRG
jgi:ACT domain-containing protein